MVGAEAQDIISTSIKDVEFDFFASELRLRGDEPVAQPHHDVAGNILCWNGEVMVK